MMTDPRSSSRRLSVLNSFIRLIMKCVKYELSRPCAELLSRFCTFADSRNVSSIFCDNGNLCATRLDEISARTSRSTKTTYKKTTRVTARSLVYKKATWMPICKLVLNIWTILVRFHFSCYQKATTANTTTTFSFYFINLLLSSYFWSNQ